MRRVRTRDDGYFAGSGVTAGADPPSGQAALRLLGRWIRAKRGSVRGVDVGQQPGPRSLSEHLTQFQAARGAGMSLRSWRDVENERRAPGARLVDGIVRSLRLDEAEEAYVRHLAGSAASPTLPRTSQSREAVDAAVAVVASHDGPAYAIDHRWRVIAVNAAVRDAAPGIAKGRSLLQWFFTSRQARRLLPDWEHEAAELVGMVRAAQAFHPHDTWCDAVMSRLAAADPTAEQLWNQQAYVSPARPVSKIRVRCGDGHITVLTAIRVQPVGPDGHGVQIVLLT